METGEIATLTALLVGFIAVLLSVFALMWQMHSQGSRNTDRLSTLISANTAEIKAHTDEIKAQGGRLSDAEREQARLEGANGTLGDILRQQSHTHEAGD